MNKFFSLLIVAILMAGCNKDETVSIGLSISPGYLVGNSKPGSIITFKVNANSEKGIKKFNITSDLSFAPAVVVVDSTVDGRKNFTISYDYLVPNSSSDYSVILTFEIVDNEGNSKNEARQINVKVSNVPLKETTGITIYSKQSGKADAFSVVDLTPQFSNLSLTSKRDIQIDSDKDATSDLSLSWISPSGGKFVKYNGFDYVNSTKLSLENAYTTGVKLDKVSDLKEDDIILLRVIKSDSVIYSALRIVSIIDQTDSENDRYIINLKK